VARPEQQSILHAHRPGLQVHSSHKPRTPWPDLQIACVAGDSDCRRADLPRFPRPPTIVLVMLSEARIHELLSPFQIKLAPRQVGKLRCYLELLLRWNQKINLTSVREPEDCVARHFGESLYLTRYMELSGRLLDVGSGAGFPGLALKVFFPALAVTLLEPIAKKRAFLKEVARTCEMTSVEVLGERLDDFVRLNSSRQFDTATARAVGRLEALVPLLCHALKPGGRIVLWIGEDQARSLGQLKTQVIWDRPLPIPLSRHRVIYCGSPRCFT
jgi:16S rRNA (guanine527-N7)-methyltransferase